MKGLAAITQKMKPARRLVWAGVAAMLVLSTVAMGWWRSAADRVAVLVIEENNGAILSSAPDRTPSPRLVDLGSSADSAQDVGGTRTAVQLDPSLVSPGAKVRVVAYHSVSSGLDLVADRAWGSPTLPFSVPVGEPVDLRDTASPGGSGVNLVQNERRLVPAEVEVVRISRGGVLELRVRGADIHLRPGEQWVDGWLLQGGAEEQIRADRWDATVEEALNLGEPLTVLRISHLGWFPRRALLGGREATAAPVPTR